MKRNLIILMLAGLLCSCHLMRQSRNDFISQRIGKYIRADCREKYPCVIRLKDATDFSWDKIYVFDYGAEDEEISDVIGTEKLDISGNVLSRKWFFVKDSKIIRFEQHVLPTVDEPVYDGSILLEENAPQEKYSIFSQNAEFEVVQNELSDDEHYFYLTCINCN